MARSRLSRLAVIGLLLCLVGCLGSGLYLLGGWEKTLEYSGSCGQFRWCTSRYWGAYRTCRLSDTDLAGELPLRSFGSAADCDRDWHLLYRDFHTRWMAGHGGGGPQGAFIQRLVRAYRSRDQIRTLVGRDDELVHSMLGAPPLALSDCGGFHTDISETSFTVALFGRFKTSVAPECWVLTDAGELRHIVPSTPVLEADWSMAPEIQNLASLDGCMRPGVRAALHQFLGVDGGDPADAGDNGCTEEVSKTLAAKSAACSRLFGRPIQTVDSVAVEVHVLSEPLVEDCVQHSSVRDGVVTYEGAKIRVRAH